MIPYKWGPHSSVLIVVLLCITAHNGVSRREAATGEAFVSRDDVLKQGVLAKASQSERRMYADDLLEQRY